MEQKFTKGNTLPKISVSRLLGVALGNLPSFIKKEKIREVSVTGERYKRIVIWDIILFLKREHKEVNLKKKKLEDQILQLTELHILYEELNSKPYQQDKDIKRMVEEIKFN